MNPRLLNPRLPIIPDVEENSGDGGEVATMCCEGNTPTMGLMERGQGEESENNFITGPDGDRYVYS